MIDRVKLIQCAVAKHFRMSTDELLKKTHQRDYARPRQIAMYLCRELTSVSYPGLSRRFAGAHHTTILFGVRRIAEMQRDPLDKFDELRADVKAIREAVEAVFAIDQAEIDRNRFNAMINQMIRAAEEEDRRQKIDEAVSQPQLSAARAA